MYLSFKRFVSLITKPCSYCGVSAKHACSIFIDRIDSSKGYTATNVISCCGKCNRLKGNLLTEEETKSIVNVLKQIRGTDNIWSHKSTTAQKRKKRR